MSHIEAIGRTAALKESLLTTLSTCAAAGLLKYCLTSGSVKNAKENDQDLDTLGEFWLVLLHYYATLPPSDHTWKHQLPHLLLIGSVFC